MTRFDLSRADIVRIARDARLDVTGVTHAAPFLDVESHLVDHIERGHTRGMDWFTVRRARESSDPRTLHQSVQSIVSVGLPFWSGQPKPPDDGVLRGRIARYAWGRDYHKVLKRRMQTMVAQIEAEIGRTLEARTLTDTARIVDRAVAARSGAGWYGKNTMIIVPGHGSWVMLGELLLDIDLPPDLPLEKNCGRCTICIDNCPTGAIVEPYRIDAPRCISYLTIEERGAIPHHLRPLMSNYVFGCDICQNVCPYTTAATPVDDPDFCPRTIDNAFPSLEMLATMTQDDFYAVYAGTPVTRAKRAGMARNAAIALGNSSDSRAEAILVTMLQRHDEPLARGHAAWALAHLTGVEAAATLLQARQRETDPSVLEEIDRALVA
jgi:epoxyqueuosine reductase